MNLIRAKESGKLSRPALILGYPILIVGYILDILMNATFVSLLVMDLPRELTVSSHLCRLSRDGNRWQRTVSTFICEQLLDAFDPSGKHCKR